MKENRASPEAAPSGPQIVASALAGMAVAPVVLSAIRPFFDRAMELAEQHTRATQLAALSQHAAVYADHSTRRAEINALAVKLYERVKRDIEGSTK